MYLKSSFRKYYPMKLINNGILKCVKSDVTQLRSKKHKRYILVTGVKYNRLVAESNLNDNKCKRGTFLSEPENIKIFVKNIHFCSWHKSRILEVGSCRLGRHPVRNWYLIYRPLKDDKQCSSRWNLNSAGNNKYR